MVVRRPWVVKMLKCRCVCSNMSKSDDTPLPISTSQARLHILGGQEISQKVDTPAGSRLLSDVAWCVRTLNSITIVCWLPRCCQSKQKHTRCILIQTKERVDGPSGYTNQVAKAERCCVGIESFKYSGDILMGIDHLSMGVQIVRQRP